MDESIIKEQLEKRLTQLETEYNEGQVILKELWNQENKLTHTLIRIEGAVQILKELLND